MEIIIERKKLKCIGEECKKKGDKGTKRKNGRKRGTRAYDIKSYNLKFICAFSSKQRQRDSLFSRLTPDFLPMREELEVISIKRIFW